MDPRSKAIELVQAADALILDFDGPVCDVFAGYPASEVAKELIKHVDFEVETDDPLEVLRRAVEVGADIDAIDLLLAELECIAIDSAIETPGVRQLLQSFDGPVGVASNNAAKAIEGWLASVDLTGAVTWVEGRVPRAMKPDPRSLLAVSVAISVPLSACVFVGDSTSDQLAASAIGVDFIGLARERSRADAFSNYGCRAIIRKVTDLC